MIATGKGFEDVEDHHHHCRYAPQAVENGIVLLAVAEGGGTVAHQKWIANGIWYKKKMTSNIGDKSTPLLHTLKLFLISGTDHLKKETRSIPPLRVLLPSTTNECQELLRRTPTAAKMLYFQVSCNFLYQQTFSI
jgi:hypothetical protein